MCRNIQTLYNFEPPAREEDVHAAALQYVRKISGFTKPSQANAEAFERAVDEITEATERLLASLVTAAPPKNREEEAAKAHARAIEREFGFQPGRRRVHDLVMHRGNRADGTFDLRFDRAFALDEAGNALCPRCVAILHARNRVIAGRLNKTRHVRQRQNLRGQHHVT